jgi:predicted ATPase
LWLADAPGNDAVGLFTERARAARPGFRAGPSDVAAIAGLCRRLDGLPLAIELAAARVSILSVAQIAERLVPDTGRSDQNAPLLLETIRQYGAAKLAASGEQDDAEAAHASFYLRLTAGARAGLDGAEQARWLDRLEAEHDNPLAVLARTVGRRRGDAARLAGLLWPFWYRRGHYQEARSWLEQVASAATAQPVAGDILAEALAGAGAARRWPRSRRRAGGTRRHRR